MKQLLLTIVLFLSGYVLLSQSCNNLFAVISPDGQYIYFSSDRADGTYHLFKSNLDGTGLQQLTNNSLPDYFPAVSPDGSKIVFQRGTYGSGAEIFIMDSDGSELIQLTSNGIHDGSPSFSPDGTLIVFDAWDGANYPEIFRMNTDGTGRTQLTTIGGAYWNSTPKYHPDGTKIYYRYGYNANNNIRSMNPDGTGIIDITPPNTFGNDEFGFDFNADGSKISFSTSEWLGHNNGFDLVIANSDGTNKQKISNAASKEYYYWTAFHPNDNEVFFAYTSNVNSSPWHINRMNIDGTAQTQVTDCADPSVFLIAGDDMVEDAQVYEYAYNDWHNADWGQDAQIPIGNYPIYSWGSYSFPDGLDRRAYFKFDLSSIPSGSNISSAIVELYYSGWNHNCNTSAGATVHRIEDNGHGPWTEGDGVSPAVWPEMSWNNQSYITISNTDVITGPPLTNPPEILSYDLTSFVQNWIEGTWENYGFVIERDNAESYCWQYLRSSESSFGQPKMTILTGPAVVADPFITTWKTDNPGTSGNTEITIPTYSGETYNYDVDWNNDGVYDDFGVTGDITHDYGVAGTYQIAIRGEFPRIYVNYNGDREKIVSIDQWGEVKWSSMEKAFYGAKQLTYSATDDPDLTAVESMSRMFDNAEIFDGDLSEWNVSNVKNMSYMFRHAFAFNHDIGSWDVSNVTTMKEMFDSAYLFNQNLNNWIVSNVTNMDGIFQNASSFNMPLSNWDITGLNSMTEMFAGADAFNQPLAGWDVSGITSMIGTFQYTDIFNQDISGWDVGNVTNMQSMFFEAESFNQDLSSWDVSNVFNMIQMFSNAYDFDQTLGLWDISGLTQASQMLNFCGMSLDNYDNTLIAWSNQAVQVNVVLDAIDLMYCNGTNARTSLINDFGWTINGDTQDCSAFLPEHFVTTWKTDNPGSSGNTEITIPTTGNGYNYDVDWDNDGGFDEFGLTGSVTHDFGSAGSYTIRIRGDFPRFYANYYGDRAKIMSIDQWGIIEWSSMHKAFRGCYNLKYNATDSPDLSLASSMEEMFDFALAFDGNSTIQNWDVSNVTTIKHMFRDAIVFNQELNGWDVSNVTNFYGVFDNAELFNQNLNQWDVSKAETMSIMFRNAKDFNGDISSWNVALVNNFASMFYGATGFNGGLSLWNPVSAINMGHMFTGASSFAGDISNWDVGNVMYMDNMFRHAGMFNSDISTWDVSSVIYMHSMFENASSFNQNLGSWDMTTVYNLVNMLSGSGLDIANYDATLIGWSTQSVTNSQTLGAHGLSYCNGDDARDILVNTKMWTIQGDTDACPNDPPVAICQAIFVNADQFCQGNAAAEDFDNGSYDPDPGDIISFSVLPQAPYNLGETNVVMTIEDIEGETSSCNTSITVQDNIPPVITCPGDMNIETEEGICAATVDYTVTSSDNCIGEIIMQTAGHASGETFPLGTTLNSFEVTDGAGLTAQCSFNVIVVDNANPEFVTTTGGSTWEQSNALLGQNAEVSDWHTPSVSISGDRVLVGLNYTEVPGEYIGEAYVYKRNGENWIVEDILIPSDGDINDVFGHAVSISGNLALVGSHFEDENGNNSGAVYVFEYDGANWVEQTKLKGNSAYDLFGFSVALEGNRALIGAYGEGYGYTGAAHIYEYDGSNWIKTATLTASDGSVIDWYGYSVSLSGNRALIGARNSNVNGLNGAGAAYVYEFNGSNWVEQTKLVPSISYSNHLFGYSVSISGDNAIISAFYDDDNGSNAGAAYAFEYNGTNWVLLNKLLASDGEASDFFGHSVSVSGDIAVVGAYGEDPSWGNTGSAYIFEKNGNSWTESQKLLASSGQNYSKLARRVTISGSRVLLGANFDDESGNNLGAALMFEIGVNQGCPDDITVENDDGLCSAYIDYGIISVIDNCSATISQDSGLPTGSDFPVGTTVNYFTAVDGSNNLANCSFTVTVIDVESPVSDIDPLPDATGECGVLLTAPTATDNCAGTLTATTPDPLNYETQGTYTISWTYDDGNGNTSQQTQTVVVDDVTAPVADIAELPDVTGECSATIPNAPMATDNCEGTIIGTTNDPLTYTEQGTYTVTWNYDDGNGNVSQQTQTVVVDDVTPPVAELPMLSDVTGECSATVIDIPTATDNCAGIILGNTNDPLTYTEQGTFTVTWTYDDGNGNASQQTQTVVVDDVTAPVLNCYNGDILINNEPGMCSAFVDYGVGLTDNCDVSLEVTEGLSSGSYFPVGITHVLLTATDIGDNQATCAFTVTVIDAEAAVADIEVLPTLTEECEVNITGTPTATDNCAGTILGTTTDPLTYTEQGTYTVTWTYDDGDENISTQTQTMIVDDITPPIITVDCQDNIALCGDQTVSWTEPQATDNCEGMTMMSSHSPGDMFTFGTTTVTYTFTDVGDNETACNFDITIRALPEVVITQNTVPDFCQGLVLLEAAINNAGDLLMPLEYIWAGLPDTDFDAIVTSNGTYDLTVEDGYNCATTVSTVVDEVSSDIVSAYVMIASKELHVEETTVTGGGIGVMQAGKKAKVKNNSVVNSFVKADIIDTDGTITIDTEIIGQVDVTLPPFYPYDSNCSGDNVTVAKNETMTLTGSVYGKVTVKQGATLIIDSEEIYFEDLDMKKESTLQFMQSSNVIVDKDMKIEKDNVVDNMGYGVTFYVGKAVDIKEGVLFTANLFAQKDIKVEGKSNNLTTMTGLFISMEKIHSKQYVDWYAGTLCDPVAIPAGANCSTARYTSLNRSIDTDISGFNVYPNPTSGFLKVEMNTNVESDVQIIISNVIGEVKIVRETTLSSGINVMDFDIGNLDSGSYQIRVVGPTFERNASIMLINM